MTQRTYLKCSVCNAVTLTRLQAGWLDWHAIIVPCGRCGILISGKAMFDPPHIELELHNASQVEETHPDFYLEISGELPAKLLHKMGEQAYVWSPPPFFQALEGMGGAENFEKFKSQAVRFLHFVDKEWPRVRRIQELWNTGERSYLAQEVHAMLPRKQWPMTNEAEFLRGVHMVMLRFFDPVLPSGYYRPFVEDLLEKITTVATDNPAGFLNLLNHFAPDELLGYYERAIFVRFQAFVDLYRHLIPAFATAFYVNAVPEDVGITTVDFETLKHFYADSYETLSEILPLALAYNNLSQRGDFQAMKTLRKDVITLNNLLEKSKGERLKFVDGNEPFDGPFTSDLDNKLRNAIAHNSYTYDRANQHIGYFPSGKMEQGDMLTITLIEFARICWNLQNRTVEMAELLYQTRKNGFVYLHGHTIVSPDVFRAGAPKKVIRSRRAPHNKRK
jgi:hypothetical protein